MELCIKSFKELSVNELYDIVKARFEVFACEQKITCENDFDDRDKESIHMFFKNDKEIMAYLRILPKGIAYKEGIGIGRMLVNKNYRRIGLARELLIEAIKYIEKNMSEENILLSAQLYVKELYKSVGFKEISDVYEEALIPHIKMMYSY